MNQILQSKRAGIAASCVVLMGTVLSAGNFAELPQAVQITALVVVGVLGVALIVGDTIRPLGARDGASAHDGDA